MLLNTYSSRSRVHQFGFILYLNITNMKCVYVIWDWQLKAKKYNTQKISLYELIVNVKLIRYLQKYFTIKNFRLQKLYFNSIKYSQFRFYLTLFSHLKLILLTFKSITFSCIHQTYVYALLHNAHTSKSINSHLIWLNIFNLFCFTGLMAHRYNEF